VTQPAAVAGLAGAGRAARLEPGVEPLSAARRTAAALRARGEG